MKERILDILKSSNVPRTAEEMIEKLDCAMEDFLPEIELLLDRGLVLRTKKGKFAIPEKQGLFTAHIRFLRNGSPMAYPIQYETPMPLKIQGGLRPLPGDLVLVRPLLGGCCTLERIIQRSRDTLAAYVRIEKKASRSGQRWQKPRSVATAVPCDLRIPYDIVLKGDLSFVRNNEIALLKIEVWPEQHRPIYASVLRVLGTANSMGALMKAVAEDHHFPTEFPEAVEAEALRFPDHPDPADYEGREDLRALKTFTIDGATAKDFDDAVSLERTERGWRLGIHIADVSHYVRPGSALDQSAYDRGTSLYLPGFTVPMLPECLSNNLCSLMPHVDRLTMSLFMDIENGRVVNHHLTNAVICSHARLTYSSVNRLFESHETDIAPDLQAILQDMRTLSQELRKHRKARGCIDFEIEEGKFILNEKGEPEDILLSPRGESERIIEDFMLLANETVAALARNTELPFIYRIHESPDQDRLKTLSHFLATLNMTVHFGADPHPGILQSVLDQMQSHPAYDVVRRYMLRALKKAQYSEKPKGHYALALEDYCHFTSPIRRYPDLVVHRMLKMLLSGETDAIAPMEGKMPEIAATSSEREFSATHGERQAHSIMNACYMSHQIGRKFDGVVSGVTSWGLYVTLKNGVEGLLHVSALNDYFEFDKVQNCLFCSATGAIFKMGDALRVRMDSADVLRGEINFEYAGPVSPSKSH